MSDPYRTPGAQKPSPEKPRVLYFKVGLTEPLEYRAVRNPTAKGSMIWVIERKQIDALGASAWVREAFVGASASARVTEANPLSPVLFGVLESFGGDLP